MTATRSAIMSGKTLVIPRRLPRKPGLAQRSEREAAIENVKTVALDLVEQRAIDRSHDQTGTLRPAIDRRQCGERLVVELASALHLKRHQRLEPRTVAMLQQLGAGNPESLHFVLRQINAAATRVLADIANDVGELKGDSKIACVDARGDVGIAEDLRRHQSHHAGDTIAIALEQTEVRISVQIEIHAHAVDHRE